MWSERAAGFDRAAAVIVKPQRSSGHAMVTSGVQLATALSRMIALGDTPRSAVSPV
jgi:hypothetical protein